MALFGGEGDTDFFCYPIAPSVLDFPLQDSGLDHTRFSKSYVSVPLDGGVVLQKVPFSQLESTVTTEKLGGMGH